MITVKLIAPGIIPGDYVTADLQGVPNRGDTVLVEFPTGCNTMGEELLTVMGVTWFVELTPGMRHHGVAGLPEVTCGLTPDAWLIQHVRDGEMDPDAVRAHLSMQSQSPTERL